MQNLRRPGTGGAAAKLDRCRVPAEAAHDLVEHPPLDVQARPGDAALALRREGRRRGAFDHGVEVRVVEYDVGRLAAELKRDALQVA